MQIEKTIILKEYDIVQMILCQLIYSGHIITTAHEVHSNDILMSSEDGEVKCIIKLVEREKG